MDTKTKARTQIFTRQFDPPLMVAAHREVVLSIIRNIKREITSVTIAIEPKEADLGTRAQAAAEAILENTGELAVFGLEFASSVVYATRQTAHAAKHVAELVVMRGATLALAVANSPLVCLIFPPLLTRKSS